MGNDRTDLWRDRVRAYFEREGFVSRTEEEVAAIVPVDLRHHEFDTFNPSAPFGARPVRTREVRAHSDALAPYYELTLSCRFDIEVLALTWLATHIEASRPQLVVDAGCGTGLALGFLAEAFPKVGFGAYDCSPLMAEICRARIERLGVQNVRGPYVAAHRERKPWLRRGTADLVVTKCAFDASHIAVIDFDAAPSPSLAREHFYGADPVARHWRMTLRSLAALLKFGGRYVSISPESPGIQDIIMGLAWRAGLEDEGVDGIAEMPPPRVEERAEDVAIMSLSGFTNWIQSYTNPLFTSETGIDPGDPRWVPAVEEARLLIEEINEYLARHWHRSRHRIVATQFRKRLQPPLLTT